MLKNELINNVLKLTGFEETELVKLQIEAKLNEILNYLNRDNLNELILPSISSAIAESLMDVKNNGTIQSLREGDMSITYSDTSPYSGRLDSFKLIRGIKDVEE